MKFSYELTNILRSRYMLIYMLYLRIIVIRKKYIISQYRKGTSLHLLKIAVCEDSYFLTVSPSSPTKQKGDLHRPPI